MQKVEIVTEFIRLDSFLKLCGVSSTGGQSKIMIIEGQVNVDGAPCTMRGKKLYPGAVVGVDGLEFQVAASP